jgi:hypothetical protein
MSWACRAGHFRVHCRRLRAGRGRGSKWRRVADQIRPKLPRLATFLDDAEPDLLA